MIEATGENLQFAEVSAVITRADGTVEDLGVLDSYESEEHFAERLRADPTAKRGILKAALGLALVLLAAQGHPEAIPAATVIVNGGQAIVTNRMIGSGTEPKFVAWGTGAGTAAVTDTTLFTESTEESRTTGTSSRVTTTVTNDTYQVVGTITVATSNKTITNVGLFDASTSGNLYLKSDFTGLALNIADSITFTIKAKFA